MIVQITCIYRIAELLHQLRVACGVRDLFLDLIYTIVVTAILV